MLKKFYEKKLKANFHSDSLLGYNWPMLQDLGIKIVLLDIDNTLALHGSHEADDYARRVVAEIKAAGLAVCIISNAKSSRIKDYAKSLKIDFMSNAAKPGTVRILDKLSSSGLCPEEAILIGDQLLTDIWAGNNAKCYTMLVKQRYQDEPFHILLKRKIERFLIARYGL